MNPSTLPLVLKLCLASLMLAGASACSEAPKLVTPAPPADTATVAAGAPISAAPSLSAQIKAEIGTAACDNAQQCRTLPVGHKACGGPEGYRAWSTKTSDGTKLAQLAARQAEEQKSADAASGRMSTCSMVTDPGATCSAGRCVLNQGVGGA